MALCTIDDIRLIFPDEAKLQRLINGNEALVTSAIEQSESEIEAYVSIKYDWPLSPFPKILGVLASKLTVCTLYRPSGKMPEVWQDACKDVQSTLNKIVKGQITLAADAGKETPTSGFSVASGKKRMSGAGGMLERYR